MQLTRLQEGIKAYILQKMEEYRKLEIRGQKQELREFMSHIKTLKLKGFTYNKKKSDDYADMIFAEKGDAACFLTKSKTLFECSVWLVLDENKIWVPNIISKSKSCLSLSEYNDVLKAFGDALLKVFPEIADKTEITDAQVSIESKMSPKVFGSLTLWESNCNKNGGICHPLDYERWLQFIIVSYKEASTLKREDLQKWLLEDRKWGECRMDIIQQLGSLYEFGMELLKEERKNGFQS